MNNSLKNILKKILVIVYYIFYNIIIILKNKNLSNKGYSLAIKKKIGQVGNNFYIEYPATIVGSKYISIGNNFSAFARLQLEAFAKHLNNYYNPEIRIGNNVSLNYDCHIGCINKIVIGNNVLIASKVFITDHFHGEITKESFIIPPSERKVISKGPVVIEDNVWIGEGVAIMPGVTLGRNCVVGANAVVTRDVPAFCVVAGIPAKVIKKFNVGV